FTALETVVRPSLIARQPHAATRVRATELLERVGLRERLAHRPGQLSGGEQQRVAVARALAQRPKLLLADEPTGNLDPATGEDVQQLMFELNHEHGAALVVATHNDRLAAAMGRTLRLAGGALHELGSGPWGRAHGTTSRGGSPWRDTHGGGRSPCWLPSRASPGRWRSARTASPRSRATGSPA